MKNTSLRRFGGRALAMTPLALALSIAGGHALAASTVYTFNADFGLGMLTGVNYTLVPNQLQLNVTGQSFPILWIANAGEDTLSKVDSAQVGSSPGREMARYRTWFNAGAHSHDAWNGAAPSRSAVDTTGNAYVANRGFQSAGYPGWAYVFKILNTTAVERNGTPGVQTSADIDNNGAIAGAEMLPLVDLNGNNIIDPSEIQDERIAWAVRVPDGVYTGSGTTPIPPRQNALARALCIGGDGNLWVGMYNTGEYWKISAIDGHTIAGPVSAPAHNYGCLIDQNGTLWGANWADGILTRIDNTTSDTGPYPATSIAMPNAVYGLALRRDAANVTHVIMGGSCNSYVDYNAATNSWSKPAAVNHCTYAVGTDNNGNILVSKQNGGVVKFDPTGAVIWDKASQVGASDSRGVIADANNDIWQVHRGSNNIAKYRGSDGAFLGVIPIGAEPYTYSDASGTAALSITTKTGNWSVVKDGGAAGTLWGTVSWNASIPAGASVATEVRASDNPVPSGAWQAVGSGTPFTLTGRYLEVKVTLNANSQNESPVVYDVTVANTALPKCDVDRDGDIDQADLSLISRARGKVATGANDPRDADGNGLITPNDVKTCIPLCTRANCATQ